MKRAQWLGAALVLASLATWPLAPLVAPAAWLAAWWFCVGIALGALAASWMHQLTGGAWGFAVRPATAWLGARLPWIALAALPWAWRLPALYPWVGGVGGVGSVGGAGRADGGVFDVARPAFRHLWFHPLAFEGRLIAYVLVWLLLSHLDRRGRFQGGRAAGALAVWFIVTSLAAVDLISALTPRWYSSVFGLLALSVQMLGGWSMTIILAVRGWPVSATENDPTPPEKLPPRARDLGNLLLAFVMLWGYLAFMQFLIIWAENLPAEVTWYVPRMQGAWGVLTCLVVAGQLVLPFGALVSRRVKDHPRWLTGVAALVLGANALDVLWNVLPSVVQEPSRWTLLAALPMLGLPLLLFAGAPRWAAKPMEDAHAAG